MIVKNSFLKSEVTKSYHCIY